MPRFQLEVATALAVGGLCSLSILYLSRPKEGKISLPTHSDSEEDTAEDPFDVITPEDVVEGYPIDERSFWDQVRFRKLALALIFAIIVAIETICIGWSAANGDTRNLVVFALRLAYSLYLLVLASCSINQASTRSHSESIMHISALTFWAAALSAETAIFPSTPSPVVFAQESYPVPGGFWYSALAVYIAACVVSITTPLGPTLHYPPDQIYSQKTVASITNIYEDNVCGMSSASPWGLLLFSYTTKVVMLGNTAASLEIGDLPIIPASMRATFNFRKMKQSMRNIKIRIGKWRPQPGSGWELIHHLVRANWVVLIAMITITAFNAVIYYAPALFLRWVIRYLEVDPQRSDTGWGWVYVAGLFSSNALLHLSTGQMWSLAVSTLQPRLKIQLNTMLFAKTLVRKDVASSLGSSTPDTEGAIQHPHGAKGDSSEKNDDDDFSSKAQVMTLMTTDVDRVSDMAWHLFSLIDSPVEVVIGSIFLYKLLGVSSFFGLAVTCLFLPMNHYAGKIVVVVQENLMKARDERVALMNEILGGIRMLKFMAWERSFEAKVMKVREKELKYQRLNYTIEVLFNAIWSATPILVQLVSFWHFTLVRRQVLTPSIAFTAISVFAEMKFALNALPETFISLFQTLVSLRRIEKYLQSAEVSAVQDSDHHPQVIAMQSATVTWPQERRQASASASGIPSAVSTPRHKFILVDLTLNFPAGKLSLVCGKLGSGKTLLLLALLGEADLLTGQIVCPRSPPGALASFAGVPVPEEKWIVEGICAYVPQAAWLRNASIKENILFSLPFDEERYQRTLEVCALVSDLKILEDGDESEIGERGVNLSGGQKARVSLARAVYSRASLLILDDVLSAVDAHTAHHLYHECLKGDLMRGRTVILVSHHVQLCAQGAEYIVSLDNGRVQFQGDSEAFQSSGVMSLLVQSSGDAGPTDDKEDTQAAVLESSLDKVVPSNSSSQTSSIPGTPIPEVKREYKPPRKLVEEEKRAVGRISRDVWETYFEACGNMWYWAIFISLLSIGAFSPVLEFGWLKYWSGSFVEGENAKSPAYYISIYSLISAIGLVIMSLKYLALYTGSLHASAVLYKRLLEAVLFANLRFHDTISRGRLLNRFGKDFEGVDSTLPDNFGRSVMYAISAFTTIVTISIVGGLPFVLATAFLGVVYYNVAKVYGQTSRDMRRLDSVTRSPLYSLYGETISGVAILRAFGAPSKFLRDMLRCVDTNICPYFWMWGVNRWLSIRFNLLSCMVLGVTATIAVLTPHIDAALAGFMLAFASTVMRDLLFLVRRFVGLEQSMVALERIKEYSELSRESPEFIEPRPPASWPSCGAIRCEGLIIRYAPDLPDVLHNLSFTIHPGEKVGILGRTGSGKSTLALSFFRFVEATEGRIFLDDVDITTVGLSDLRSRLTIIPQDPTILSGSLRSTLDVFDEYQDAEIFEALRRVHLIPSEDTPEDTNETVNANVFRNLDSPVSEGGENFSTGEKQLLCMARAILKRSKLLVMDEATASVDYATDELISKTIRHEFAESTILTIAHRLRTVIDYDRVMLLDNGHIVELDKPAELLRDSTSKFYSLCKATGKAEFAVLKKMAGV